MIAVIEPRDTQALSVTGNFCALNCIHCRGHFLKGMDSRIDWSKSSYLVSGGCDKDGRLPLDIPLLKMLKARGKRINLHLGYVDENSARIASEHADVCSIEFNIDTKSIKYFRNLSISQQEITDSFMNVSKHCRTIPHVVIGIGDELKNLEALCRLGAERIVLLVLTNRANPLLREPGLDRIGKAFAYAREHFKHVTLGCMRPWKNRREIDTLAVKFVDGIVLPHRNIDVSGMHKKYECCALC